MKALDIVTVLVALGNARSCIKTGEAWVSAPCPFARWNHKQGRDRSASFGVSVNEGGPSGFNCMACGAKGTLTTLVHQLSDLRNEDLGGLLSKVIDLELPELMPSWESRTVATHQLPEPLDEEEFDSIFPPARESKLARQYLKSRHLSPFSLTYRDLRWDEFRKRILFKAKQDGLFYGTSGRSVRAEAKQKVKVYNYHKSMFLLGEELVDLEDTSRPVVVIEGLMGLLETDSCNLPDYADAVALQGSDMSIEQRDRLVSWCKPVILLLDPDKSGREGTYGKRLAGGARKEGALEMLKGLVEVRAADWPEGVTDLNELLESELRQIVEESASFDY